MSKSTGLLDSMPAIAPKARKEQYNVKSFLVHPGMELPLEHIRLQVSFGSKHVGYGTKLSPYESFDSPDVCVLPLASAQRQDRAEAALFTIICIDPDPPLGLGQIVHFLRYNVEMSVDSTKTELLPGHTTVIDHVPPAPPMNTGEHRYIYFAFGQSGHIPEGSESMMIRNRQRF